MMLVFCKGSACVLGGTASSTPPRCPPFWPPGTRSRQCWQLPWPHRWQTLQLRAPALLRPQQLSAPLSLLMMAPLPAATLSWRTTMDQRGRQRRRRALGSMAARDTRRRRSSRGRPGVALPPAPWDRLPMLGSLPRPLPLLPRRLPGRMRAKKRQRCASPRLSLQRRWGRQLPAPRSPQWWAPQQAGLAVVCEARHVPDEF